MNFRSALAAAALLFFLPGLARAHRLDEYLQAARFALRRDAVELRLDLTPGVAILPDWLPQIDLNRDGRIDPAEEKTYLEKLARDLHLDLDGQSLRLEIVRFTLPPEAGLLDGEGSIQVTFISRIPTLAPGRHTLLFRNDHLPKISAYLVNALRPDDNQIAILRQTRDDPQRHYRLDFQVGSE